MKILFVHLPRTAGTFLREYGHETKLINYYANKGQRDGHLSASEIQEPEKWFKFGLIRNPFDWYVSQYHYYAGKTKPDLELGIYKGVDGGLWGEKFLKRFPTFEDWMFYGYIFRKVIPYFWLINVYDYMFLNRNGEMLLDYIGKYEDLYKVVDWVFKENKIEPEIKLKDFGGFRNSSKHDDYKEYYSRDTKEYVETIDWILLRRYGYEY